jgi:hypothetical protein
VCVTGRHVAARVTPVSSGQARPLAPSRMTTRVLSSRSDAKARRNAANLHPTSQLDDDGSSLQIAIELDITYSLCSFFIIDIDFLVTFNHSYYLNKLSILLLNKV